MSPQTTPHTTAKHGNLQSNFDAYRFGELLLELAGRNSRLSECFLTTSGAVANESALKICYQKHAPASRVIAFKHCFMGRTVTMSQIGDSAGNRQGIPLSTQVDYMGFWNDEAAEKVGGKDAFIDHECWRLKELFTRYPRQHACFIFELVQGEGGFTTAPREFYVRLMEMCKEHGVAVWADEVQSFGRTEQMFAFEHFDLGEYVDVVTVGKSREHEPAARARAHRVGRARKSVGKGFRIFVEFLGNLAIFRIGDHRNIGRVHGRHDFHIRTVHFRCHIDFIDIDRVPNIGTGR